MLRRLCLLPFCLFFLVAAAPPTPMPRGGDYDVRIRYRIFAFRTERIRQYRQLRADLAAAGFERDPDEVVADNEADDPNASMMRGTVPASGVKRLLAQRHIRSLLLTPKGVKWPEKGTRVRVEITLDGG